MAECSTSELCVHKRPKLTLLHLFTDLLRKEILPHSSEYLQGYYNQLYMRIIYAILVINYLMIKMTMAKLEIKSQTPPCAVD